MKIPEIARVSKGVKIAAQKDEAYGSQGQAINTGDRVTIPKQHFDSLPDKAKQLLKPDSEYEVVSAYDTHDTIVLKVADKKVSLPSKYVSKPINWESKKTMKRSEVQKLIRETVMNEIARSEIEKNIGKEVAMVYRKQSTGEVKTYFGRITKIEGENFYAGLLGKGLRSLKIANVQKLSPANLRAEQKLSLDEMCGKNMHEETEEELKTSKSQAPLDQATKPVTSPATASVNEKYMGFKKLVKSLKSKGVKEEDILDEDAAALAAWIGRRKYGKKAFQKKATAGKRK